MFIAFGIQGFAILWLLSTLSHPIWFVVSSGAAFFFWGEMYSLFPAMIGDLYGRKNAGANYGLLYTAKGVASIWAGPVAAGMFEAQHSWTMVFWIAAIANFIASAMALFVLKRMSLPKPVLTPRMVPATGGGGE